EVRSAGPATINYSLALEPLRLQAATALPALPDPSRAKPPELPLLTDTAPQFFDLERSADTTFLLRADAPALYRLQSTGLLPTVTADLTRHFEPGTYRIVSLPEAVATRRVTLFERVRQAAKREGHGPHALGLAERVEHVWTEPEAGQARVPDAWLVTVPAPID